MGQINTTNVTDFETIDEYNNNKLINDNDESNMDIDNNSSSNNTSNNSDIDYELYQTFWKLQSFFSDENKTFESVQKFKEFRRYHHQSPSSSSLLLLLLSAVLILSLNNLKIAHIHQHILNKPVRFVYEHF